MNELARMWAERELHRHERRQLRKMIEQLRIVQSEMKPLVQKARRRRQAQMRQDGPRGFVMQQRGTRPDV